MKSIVAASAAFVAWQAAPVARAPPPLAWALTSAATWTAHLLLRRRGARGAARANGGAPRADGGARGAAGGPLSEAEKLIVVWGYASCLFLLSLLDEDPGFKGWGDVYFFCGREMQYCSCDFRWNARGWFKAAVLWNFVLSAALGAQRLLVQIALGGFLPGEESVTFESFISVCWRLVPYYLNQWEAKWGAECTSMMFELPHFATELLIVLPFVQILTRRLKILAAPQPSAQLPPGPAGARLARLLFAPDAIGARWEHDPTQRRLGARLRRNRQALACIALVVALAGANALLAPLRLEEAALRHPLRGAVAAAAGAPGNWTGGAALRASLRRAAAAGGGAGGGGGAVAGAAGGAPAARARPGGGGATGGEGSPNAWALARALLVAPPPMRLAARLIGRALGARPAPAAPPSGATPASRPAAARAAPQTASNPQASITPPPPDWGLLERRVEYYEGARFKACPSARRLQVNMERHHKELSRMEEPEHRALVVVVEAALALMRLGCERFFLLASLHLAYVLFHEPPPAARAAVRVNGAVSAAFQAGILYAFPALCWYFGAGVIFSSFVSVVFWGAPAARLHAWASRNLVSVTTAVRGLRPAGAAEVERMGGSCAICWGGMAAAGAAGGEAGGGGAAADAAAAGGDGPAAEGADAAAAGGPAAEGAAGAAAAAGAGAAAAAGGRGAAGAEARREEPADPEEAREGQEEEGEEDEPSEGVALPCGHAYHQACLHTWLDQCRSQRAAARCPMCQGAVALDVRWRLHVPPGRPPGAAEAEAERRAAAAAAAAAEAAFWAPSTNYIVGEDAALRHMLYEAGIAQPPGAPPPPAARRAAAGAAGGDAGAAAGGAWWQGEGQRPPAAEAAAPGRAAGLQHRARAGQQQQQRQQPAQPAQPAHPQPAQQQPQQQPAPAPQHLQPPAPAGQPLAEAGPGAPQNAAPPPPPPPPPPALPAPAGQRLVEEVLHLEREHRQLQEGLQAQEQRLRRLRGEIGQLLQARPPAADAAGEGAAGPPARQQQ